MKMFFLPMVLGSILAVSAVAADALSPDQTAKGLQAALTSLVNQSVATLGDAKATGEQLSVPLPEKLNKLEAALKAVGEGKLMEDFKAKLKGVALESLPQTKGLFKEATADVKISDPEAVLAAAPAGLTDYVKQQTRGKIVQQVLPIVASKNKTSGLVASYEAMVAKAGPFASKIFGKQPPVNLDQYVSEQSVDYVYGLMGKGETALRANPSLANNALVKQVFAAAKK